MLEFATNFTMIAGANGRENGSFEKFEQIDLREGTFPVGSVWRPIGKIIRWTWYVLRSDVNLIYSSKCHALSSGRTVFVSQPIFQKATMSLVCVGM